MKIIPLVDDMRHHISCNPLKKAHELSLLIQHNNKTLLFDTGPSDAILHNSRKLHINLHTIDHIIISHPHYDQIGGLPYVLTQNQYTYHRIVFNPATTSWGHSPFLSATPHY